MNYKLDHLFPVRKKVKSLSRVRLFVLFPILTNRRKGVTNLDSVLKSQDITLQTNVHIVKAMVFPYGSHVWMCELDHKENWALKD